ncbi:MAG: hypothetical protein FJW88_14510 [Actinobacteria bacterium]|nr:hypothetical protein [Actinomycetota bacterium]
MRRAVLVVAVVGALATTLVGASAPAGAKSRRPVAIVFNGQGNNLDAYASVPPFRHQRVITNHDDDPDGLDLNAQICFFPERMVPESKGNVRWFIAGEDTGQPDPPQGWGIFALRGNRVGHLSAKRIGKLTPTYQAALDNAENYGCGFLPDGRVLTTDIGNQAAGEGDGQLIMWFPPFDRMRVRYCKIDVAIATAGGLAVDRTGVYVTSARPPTAGVWRYEGPFPTSDTAAGGCGRTDPTGAPLADTVNKSLFIPPGGPLVTPNAIVRSPDGWYVSSVFNGVIAEFHSDGTFRRTVLAPPAGESLGAQPYSTGTPLGLGVDRRGNLFYADIGLVIDDGVGPGDGTGSLRRIRFVDGEPRPPKTMAEDLAFPDGIGVLQP